MTNKGWHSRHYLPHYDSSDVTQFVTFRLADSLPREVLARVQNSERAETLREDFLDQGLGACWLKSEQIAQSVESSFFQFDGDRYHLHAWTIMPNHVHVLFSAKNDTSLGAIIGSWKRFTARKANGLLSRKGPFWQTEYWDRFIRNEQHFHAIEQYIDNNPVKAKLVTEARFWPYGSARFKIAQS